MGRQINNNSNKSLLVLSLVKIFCSLLSVFAVVGAAYISVDALYIRTEIEIMHKHYPETSFNPRILVETPIHGINTPSATQVPGDQNGSNSMNGCGMDWVTCWDIDDNAQTITWKGDSSTNADIGQVGIALLKIRMGYKAIVNLKAPMNISICQGNIDGIRVEGNCPVIQRLEPGVHEIYSPDVSGGFRIQEP